MMPKQTVIVTGGNQGLGYACARSLARDSRWHVMIASRSMERAATAVQQLREKTGHSAVDALPLDLASLESIRQFARQFATQPFPPLRAIVCNAGIQIMSGTQYTADDFETTFGVNHLGHFLLVNLLLSQLVTPARIVVVSSGTHDPDTMDGRLVPAHYTSARELAYPATNAANATAGNNRLGMERYVTSKLCNMLFTYELVRRLEATGIKGISVNAFDPGAVPGTGLTRDYSGGIAIGVGLLKGMQPLLEGLGMNFHSVNSSGEAMARLVLDPALEGVTGRYFQWRNERKSSTESYDTAKAATLWDDSATLVGLRNEESPLSSLAAER